MLAALVVATGGLSGTGVAAWVADGVPICGPGCAGRLPQITAGPEGGAYVAWRDIRVELPSLPERLYVQRITAEGEIAPGWPVNGIPVSRDSSGLRNTAIEPDGVGDVYVAWGDFPGNRTARPRRCSRWSASRRGPTESR